MFDFFKTKKQREHTAKVAADWWADRLQQGDKEKFKNCLIPWIIEELDKGGPAILSVDYDPQDQMLVAVQAAGMECSGNLFSARGILPAKHNTIIFDERIEPKEGYGNRTATIDTKL